MVSPPTIVWGPDPVYEAWAAALTVLMVPQTTILGTLCFFLLPVPVAVVAALLLVASVTLFLSEVWRDMPPAA